MEEFRKPYYQADLGLSVRKVSNGYSVKINHSIVEGAVGRIIIAENKDEVLKILGAIFTENEKVKKDDNGFYG